MKNAIVNNGVIHQILSRETSKTEKVPVEAAPGMLWDGVSLSIDKNADGYNEPSVGIDLARDRKISELRSKCESKINAGFNADILFPDCNYRNDRDQQTTMKRSASKSSGGYIWMNESFTHHTQAQAIAVLDISDSEIELHRIKYDLKCKYVNDQSRTEAEINSVTWDSIE